MNRAIISLLLIACFLAGCSGQPGNPERVFEDLCEKSTALESYGVEFLFAPTNQTVKHQYFAKNTDDVMMIRSDFKQQNLSVITIADGTNFFIYYPDNSSAERAPLPPQKPELEPVYPSAACIPQQFGLAYLGEEMVDGVPCALVNYTIGQQKGTTECYALENGVRLYTATGETVVFYYTNYSFDLSPETFTVPASVPVTERTAEEILATLNKQ